MLTSLLPQTHCIRCILVCATLPFVHLAELGRLQMCEVVKVQRCSSLTDASLLQNVRQLSLTHCDQLANVSKLGSGTVSDLDLSGCRRVADVSLLGTIRKLSLRHCTRVHDVSALGGVHELDLAGTSVVDVSALGEVHDLNLANTAVADVSKLGQYSIEPAYHRTALTGLIGPVHPL